MGENPPDARTFGPKADLAVLTEKSQQLERELARINRELAELAAKILAVRSAARAKSEAESAD